MTTSRAAPDGPPTVIAPEVETGATGPAVTPPLTPLPGSVIAQFVRCGKPTCHCAGGPRHGPYHFRVWREGAQVRKVYIRQADVAQARAACAAYAAARPASFRFPGRGPAEESP